MSSGHGQEISRLTLEWELLLLAARQHLTDTQLTRLGDLIECGVDWETVLIRARAAGVRSLLRRHLARISSAEIPPSVRDELEKGYRFRAIVNLRNWKQLREIGAAFNNAGIPIAVLKGAFFAYWVYDDPALRPMSDLDLLCREDDWTKVKQILAALGYRQKAEKQAFFTLHPSPFIRERSATVEVHTSLRGRWPGEELLSRSRIVQRDGVSFRTLAVQDLIRYQVAHIAQHCHSPRLPLYWFADLNEIISREPAPDAPLSVGGDDTEQERVRSFLCEYWISSARLLPGAPVSDAHEVFFAKIAGKMVPHPGQYLRALRNIGRIGGLWLKMDYLRSLAFPSVERMVKAGQMKPEENVYWCYLRRAAFIFRRAIGFGPRRADS